MQSTDKKPKHEKCVWSHPDIRITKKQDGSVSSLVYKCLYNDERLAFGKAGENHPTVNKETCENCPHYESRYIEYPITVNSIVTETHDDTADLCGKSSLCAVRPCGKELNGRTFIGIFLGELILQPTASFNKKTGELTVGTMTNPAIFVPELNKVVWGCESWWAKIDSLEDFREITDQDIGNQWYVQLLKTMCPAQAESGVAGHE